MTPEEYVAFHQRRFAMLVGLLERHVRGRIERSLDIGGAGDLLGLGVMVRERFGAESHAVALGEDPSQGREEGLISDKCDVDRERLPFDDAAFDLVIFTSVLEHLYHPRHAMGEIARVLKPGALLLLETPNAVSMGRRIDLLKGRNPFRWFNEYNAIENRKHMHCCAVFYTVDEVTRLLADDFDICEQVYGLHTPCLSFPKMLVHEVLTRLFPAMSDCFAMVARRKAAGGELMR
jgi:SAM-dependent methyltransferase